MPKNRDSSRDNNDAAAAEARRKADLAEAARLKAKHEEIMRRHREEREARDRNK